MRDDIRYVPFQRFQDAIVRSGLPFEELAGFVKVQGPRGRKVYVPRTQRVGRVDISGFTVGPEVCPVVDLTEDERWGAVHQQLDFGGDEEATLQGFARLLDHMRTLEPVEQRARPARGSEAGDTGRRRLGRPSMTTPPPEGPSAQEGRRAAQVAGRQEPQKAHAPAKHPPARHR